MRKRTTWILVALGALALAVIVVLSVALVVTSRQEPAAEPTPQPSVSTAPSATRSPTPTSSPTPTAIQVAATCETTTTAGFRAVAAAAGWVSHDRTSQPNGGNPFADFPGGPPKGTVSCSWAPANVNTDNATFLAWAPIVASAGAAAQQALVAQGGHRTETPSGVLVLFSNEGGGDRSFLFTDTDVRWALSQTELGFVKAPDEAQ